MASYNTNQRLANVNEFLTKHSGVFFGCVALAAICQKLTGLKKK